jgi:hypothetical protein
LIWGNDLGAFVGARWYERKFRHAAANRAGLAIGAAVRQGVRRAAALHSRRLAEILHALEPGCQRKVLLPVIAKFEGAKSHSLHILFHRRHNHEVLKKRAQIACAPSEVAAWQSSAPRTLRRE